jgi:hypothetical protein
MKSAHIPIVALGGATLFFAPLSSAHSNVDAQKNSKVIPSSPSTIVHFNPTLNRIYTLEVQSQQRMRSGQIITFTTRHNLRFFRLDDQLSVDAVLTDIHCDGPEAFAKIFTQSMAHAKGFLMRAHIPAEGVSLIPVQVPAADAHSILAELGAADLGDQLLAKADGDQSASAPVSQGQTMWLDDIASIMRFTNVDLDQLAQSMGAEWQIERTNVDQWTVRTMPTAQGKTKIASEFAIDWPSGMVLKSNTETWQPDPDGKMTLLSRKLVRIL